jgi:glycosyltransferase involved in cell wall biosynthesis
MKQPLLAIVIPVYNTASYLDQCIGSALNQGIEDVEIHCFENGSTDESPQLLEKWAKRDNRIKIHTIANEEWSDVQSIDWSRDIECKYLCRIDSDDYLESGFLVKLLPILEEEELDMLFFEGESFFETEELRAETNPYYIKAYKYQGEYSNVSSGVELFSKFMENNEYYVSMCMYVCRKEFLKESEPKVFTPRIERDGDSYVTTLRLLAAKRVRVFKGIGYRRRIRYNSLMTKVAEPSSIAAIFIQTYEVIASADTLSLFDNVRLSLGKMMSSQMSRARRLAEQLQMPFEEVVTKVTESMNEAQRIFACMMMSQMQTHRLALDKKEEWLAEQRRKIASQQELIREKDEALRDLWEKRSEDHRTIKKKDEVLQSLWTTRTEHLEKIRILQGYLKQNEELVVKLRAEIEEMKKNVL